MKQLYIDTTNSGISGDMFLAALLDLTSEHSEIIQLLEKLPDYFSGVSKLKIKLDKIDISGIKVNQLQISLKERKNHRKASTLRKALNEFLNSYDFSESAKNYGNQVLNTLIDAEIEVHNKAREHIHLHELSSVDTLLDILGTTKALEKLGLFEENCQIYCSELPIGGGLINAAHGSLAVPAPATIKILEKSNLVIKKGPIDGEIVTPTGAALLTNLNPITKNFKMNLKRTAYSTGQREFKNFLNLLRLFYGDDKEASEVNDSKSLNNLQKYSEPLVVLETNIDDVSGEIIGHFIDSMTQEEILDVQVISTLTKKNRPGYLIKVLCHPEHQNRLIKAMMEDLGTLGVRYQNINRICIERIIKKEQIEIKKKRYYFSFKLSFYTLENQKVLVNIKPEFDDLKRISIESNLSVKRVQLLVQSKLNSIAKEF
ncbi:MAG: nickel pincer cofactor biosynthesis protein LarC [Candidatus Lokiarchaeota archaeon]|nr:nickel pincer cofactor biosynthesis protein LarC [Candidatus Lokiarchaeota archaeon]MBD3338758.1 nickel pincer cofactor biosynthesis protein LarC [Candidatus Lokiarchaeota archaeon]